MHTRFRILGASAVFAIAWLSASTSSASTEAALDAYCFSDLYGGAPGHDFAGGGLCYTCEPNTCHLGTWSGSCDMHHYVCEGTR